MLMTNKLRNMKSVSLLFVSINDYHALVHALKICSYLQASESNVRQLTYPIQNSLEGISLNLFY